MEKVKIRENNYFLFWMLVATLKKGSWHTLFNAILVLANCVAELPYQQYFQNNSMDHFNSLWHGMFGHPHACLDLPMLVSEWMQW